jgi:hypothetical protein
METKDIRILDPLNVKLPEILKCIPDGQAFYWSILLLDGTPNPGRGKFLTEYQKKIDSSENGLRIEWDDLFRISSEFYQMFEVILIGSKTINLLHTYETESEMIRACDIVIELIDCAFWEIYTKNKNIIQNIETTFSKFKYKMLSK